MKIVKKVAALTIALGLAMNASAADHVMNGTIKDVANSRGGFADDYIGIRVSAGRGPCSDGWMGFKKSDFAASPDAFDRIVELVYLAMKQKYLVQVWSDGPTVTDCWRATWIRVSVPPT